MDKQDLNKHLSIKWSYSMKILRKAIGMTQEELANKVGISRQAINAIENNRMSPNLTHAFKIALALNQEHIEDVFIYEE